MNKNVLYKLFFIACIQGLAGFQQAYAATYYVAPNGNDANTGTTLSAPVKTITKAVSKAQLRGDIINVMTGTYVEAFAMRQNGITLSAYPGNSPVIDGGTTLPARDWEDLITVYGDNNTISGFELKNSNVNGRVEGSRAIRLEGQYNRISKVKVHHTWDAGIVVFGDNNIVEDSIIYQAGLWNSAAPDTQGIDWPGALSTRFTSNTIMRRNTIYNNWGEGIILMDADHPIVEDNIVYDNWTHNLYFCNVQNGLMQGNMVYNSLSPTIVQRSKDHGILLTDEYSSPSIPSSNNNIINNLVYNANINAFPWVKVANSGLKNVLIANNTIVDGNLNTGSGGSLNITNINSQIRNNIITGKNSNVPSKNGITFSHNNWSVTPSAAAAATNIVGDPQIARTGATTAGVLTSRYFKIPGSSPVTDAAMPLNIVVNDFFKSSRGTVPDIGGHEFGASSTSSNNNTADSTAPSAPSGLSATASSSTQVSLAWKASTDNVSVAGYKVYRDGTEIGTNTATSFTDASVVGGTTYSYAIKAYDAAGNFSASSNTATVNTLQATPTVNISSYSVENITANSADINWTTNMPSTGVVSYGTSADNLGSRASVGNQATSQSVQISGLNSGTVYYYKISVNNGSAAAVSSFSTASGSRRWSRRG